MLRQIWHRKKEGQGNKAGAVDTEMSESVKIGGEEKGRA